MPRGMLSVPTLTFAALAVAAGAYASLTSGGPRMGPTTTIKRPAFHGYYDGHKDTYLNTDVSNKAQARTMHISYAPVLKTVPLKSAPEIYLVQGKAAAGQLAVFGSEPGEASYSPIWKERCRRSVGAARVQRRNAAEVEAKASKCRDNAGTRAPQPVPQGFALWRARPRSWSVRDHRTTDEGPENPWKTH